MSAPREGGKSQPKTGSCEQGGGGGGNQSNADVGIEKKNDLFGNTFGPI